MQRRVKSMIMAMLLMCCICCNSIISVNAENVTNQQVDGSYLTMNESSTSEIEYNPLLRGEHLMDGTVTISKAGVKKVFVYGSTTANHTVDHVRVNVYVEEYNPDDGTWEQIDYWYAKADNDYYAVTQKTVYVDGGHYYRARCEHFAWNEEDSVVDESITATDGIWVD